MLSSMICENIVGTGCFLREHKQDVSFFAPNRNKQNIFRFHSPIISRTNIDHRESFWRRKITSLSRSSKPDISATLFFRHVQFVRISNPDNRGLKRIQTETKEEVCYIAPRRRRRHYVISAFQLNCTIYLTYLFP